MGKAINSLVSTPKSKVTSTLPPWYTDAATSALDAANKVNETPYTPYSGIKVAGTNGVNKNLRSIFDNPVTVGLDKDYYKPALSYAKTSANPFTEHYDPQSVEGERVGTEMWNPEMASQYMNPYIAQALAPALRDIQNAGARSMNDIGSKAAARGAFGGLRQGYLEGQNEKNTLQSIGDTSARGYKDAYDTAFSNFSTDYGRKLDADRSNQSTFADLGKFNESQRLSGFKANADVHDMNSRNSLASALGIKSLADSQVAKTNANFDRQLKAGVLQRGVNQELLDSKYQDWKDQQDKESGQSNYDNLLKLLSAANPGGSSVQPGDNKIANGIGLAAQVASIFAGSDIRLKEDIVPIGQENGFDIYEFSYKGDKKRFVGVLAQEVARKRPDAVCKMSNGMLGVNYGAIGVKMKEVCYAT